MRSRPPSALCTDGQLYSCLPSMILATPTASSARISVMLQSSLTSFVAITHRLHLLTEPCSRDSDNKLSVNVHATVFDAVSS